MSVKIGLRESIVRLKNIINETSVDNLESLRDSIAISDINTEIKGRAIEDINRKLHRKSFTSEALVPLSELTHDEIIGNE